MSSREKFFTPASLVRVVEAVEWEPDLVLYPDGSSNQGRYMEALAILYGRWLAFETIPDFLDQAQAISSRDWVSAFRHVVSEIPEKIRQMVGFYRGLGGVVFRKKTLFGLPVNPWTGEIQPLRSSIENEVFLVIGQLVADLLSILEEE